MHDLYGAIAAGWEKVRALVEGDSEEMRRRLLRRKGKVFTMCPRAWCLVVRAGDRRIDEAYGWDVRQHAGWTSGHEVTVDARLVRKLVEPVWTDRPYSEKDVLARKLGVAPRTLDRAIAKGEFSLRGIPLLGGKRGHPVPVMFSRKMIDPGSGWSSRGAHWVWWTEHRWLSEHVPGDLEETLVRVPVFRRWVPAELRRNVPEAKRARARELAERRANAEAEAGGWGDAKERREEKIRKRRFRGMLTGELAELGSGWALRGYEWICPMCKKRVRKLYYPLPVYYSLRLLEEEYPDGHELALPPCPRRFGCWKCHRVKFFTLTNPGAWNEVICQLSGGLLYGSEVEKPKWWAKAVEEGRRRRFVPKLMRTPSKRRGEVMELLLKGMKRREMAKALGVGRSRVDTIIDRIYKEHRVHSVGELREVVAGDMVTEVTKPL